MELSERIKNRREEKGFSQTQLAELVGVRQQTIQKIESNIIKQPRNLLKIAMALDVPPEYLQFGLGSQKKFLRGYVPVLEWNEVMRWCAGKEKDLDLSEKNRDFIANPNPDNLSKNQFALKIKNNTMTSPLPGEMSFSPGTYIIADPDCQPENESYIVGIWPGSEEAIVRQYVLEGNTSYSRPLNPQYPTQETKDTFVPLAVAIARFDLLLPSARRFAK